MLKIERILLVFGIAIGLQSCSEYQTVLNKGTAAEQYKLATKLYEEGKYSKAIDLFEKVIPSYGRKPQLERIQYMVAMANYNTKNYDLASYYFNRFISNYPQSSKIEEASFLSAHSQFLSTPKYSRDQGETDKALQALQNFIDKYPNSDKVELANKYYDDLTNRLETKAYEIAKQYYTIEDYKAAIVAFDNFLIDYIASPFKENAMYYKFKASNDLAIKSVLYKKEKRLNDAITAYHKFKKNFPESGKNKELERDFKALEKELVDTKKIIEQVNNNNTQQVSNGL